MNYVLKVNLTTTRHNDNDKALFLLFRSAPFYSVRNTFLVEVIACLNCFRAPKDESNAVGEHVERDICYGG